MVNKINLLRKPLLRYQYFNNGIKSKKTEPFYFAITICKTRNKWQKEGHFTTSVPVDPKFLRILRASPTTFYASPNDVTWGSENNPDLFMKIWFDVSGRVDVNFFHVSVPDIEVYSDLPDESNYDQKGTTIMDNRYIRHEYLR